MHTKQALARLSRARLILALLSALTMLKISNPKAYNQVEVKLFNEKHVRASRKRRKSKRDRLSEARKRVDSHRARPGDYRLLNPVKKKRRANPRAKKAMLYMRKHKVSLKEAWKHV